MLGVMSRIHSVLTAAPYALAVIPSEVPRFFLRAVFARRGAQPRNLSSIVNAPRREHIARRAFRPAAFAFAPSS
jgi:hypothetical protein